MTLFTVMVGVVGCIFGQLHPGRSPAQVHILLTAGICFNKIQAYRMFTSVKRVRSVNVVSSLGRCEMEVSLIILVLYVIFIFPPQLSLPSGLSLNPGQ